MSGHLDRRQLLVWSVSLGALSWVASGCSDSEPLVSLAEDPVRLETLGAELSLIDSYERLLAVRPDVRAALAPILDEHRRHAESLAGPETTPPQIPAVPGDPSVAWIREQERQAAGQRAGACVRADRPELASLLCLIGASEAQHVVALGAVQ